MPNIKMLTTVGGRNAEQSYEVEQAEGDQLVATGQAEWVHWQDAPPEEVKESPKPRARKARKAAPAKKASKPRKKRGK